MHSPSNHQVTLPVLQDTIKKPFNKPPCSYKDTLVINKLAIVFFYPDSLQLENIKIQLDSNAFEGMQHESFYQMRFSRITVENKWPQIAIQNAKNYRYLKFLKENGSSVIIDLNSIPDVYGSYLFNRKKEPVLTDMTNIETVIANYMEE